MSPDAKPEPPIEPACGPIGGRWPLSPVCSGGQSVLALGGPCHATVVMGAWGGGEWGRATAAWPLQRRGAQTHLRAAVTVWGPLRGDVNEPHPPPCCVQGSCATGLGERPTAGAPRGGIQPPGAVNARRGAVAAAGGGVWVGAAAVTVPSGGTTRRPPVPGPARVAGDKRRAAEPPVPP